MFHVSDIFNCELVKWCRGKCIVTLRLYEFIHTVIKNTNSLNVDRFDSSFSYSNFPMRCIIQKGNNLDFEPYKEYLKALPFLQSHVNSNIYIVIQYLFHIS